MRLAANVESGPADGLVSSSWRHVSPTAAGVQAGAQESTRQERAKLQIEHCEPGVTQNRHAQSRESMRCESFREKWSRRSGLNGRPADYESAALPTELRRQGGIIRFVPHALSYP